MIARVPGQGGAVWAVLQYLLGLRELGHEVHFIEPISNEEIRPVGACFSDSDNASYIRQVAGTFGLQQVVSLLNTDTRETVGLPYGELLKFAHRCDVLINISGLLRDEGLLAPIPIRAYLDLDPAFTQMWNTVQGIDVGFGHHNRFVTIGMLIGGPECQAPDCGRSWIKTLQPIVLSHWQPARLAPDGGFTTIANWRGYGSIEIDGQLYGQKAHSLRPFFALPKQIKEKFILALAIHPDEVSDLQQLRQNDWQLVDPKIVAGTPLAFRQFIHDSKAEFGIAKSGYVASNCGWFSDRSICYLASGRPVIAQETGFSAFLPCGTGLFAFKTQQDVVTAINDVNSNYAIHAKAAHRIAEEYFESGKVLRILLRAIGAA